jgi:predicted adenylyl cyclase CyaB
MRELEAKLFVPETHPVAVLRALEAEGRRFSPGIEQTDFVFARSGDVILNPDPGTVVARVRYEDNGSDPTLTVKKRRSTELDRDEIELRVDSGDNAKALLSMLGVTQLVTVKKKRWKSIGRAGVSVLVDAVDELGTFIEIEILGQGPADSLARLEALVSHIHGRFPRAERVSKGYDRLLLER